MADHIRNNETRTPGGDLLMSQHKVWTRSRRLFDLVEPDPGEVRLSDIVLPLSEARRYACQSQLPLTVASHSIILSRHVPAHLRPAAILHDTAEAYTGDIIAPLKNLFPDFAMHYQSIELGILEAIETAFEVDFVRFMAELDRWDKALAEIEMYEFYGRDTGPFLIDRGLAGKDIRRASQMKTHEIAFEFLLAICDVAPAARSDLSVIEPSVMKATA